MSALSRIYKVVFIEKMNIYLRILGYRSAANT